MKKITSILFILFFAFVAQTNAQNKTLDDIFKTADDIVKVFEKAGEYYDKVQKTFAYTTVMNVTSYKVEFLVRSTSLVNGADTLILGPAQDETYGPIIMPMNTDEIQVNIIVKAWLIIRKYDEKGNEISAETIPMQVLTENLYYSRGSTQKYKTLTLYEKNDVFWLVKQ